MIAIRDSFITLLPITFFGVLLVLLKDLPLPAYQSAMIEHLGPDWQKHLQPIIDATHGLLGMTLCALLAVHIARRIGNSTQEELPDLTVAMAGLTNFMIIAATRGTLTPEHLGQHSILVAIGVGIFSAEALRWAAVARWLSLIRMPYDTDPNFYHAIRLSIPVITIGLAAAATAFGLQQLPAIEASPLQDLIEAAQGQGGGAWWLSSIAVLINQVVWFLGSHGNHILDAYAVTLFAPYGAPYDGTLAWRPMFDSFVLIGGSGATLGLLIAIAFSVREGPTYKLAQLSILPGIFNINETVLYGLPVVLNPIFLFPFIAVPLLLNLLALAGASLGLLEFQLVSLPWTTPPIVSGWLLTGSWHGAVFQILEIGLSAAIYLPFVRRAEATRLREQSEKLAETTGAILSEGWARAPAFKRHDDIGLMARGLLADLRKALAKGALNVTYQPKHSLDGRVIGVEALLRWTHHRLGELSPAMATTLAEDSGDIHRLGHYMLEQACACKARWNKEGFGHLIIAVNVSPLQLTDPMFVPRLAASLIRHDLKPHEIELELIESRHTPDSIAVETTLSQLSKLGVRLAIDDFGMGYSSMLHLRRFRVHTIKIAGSLTADVLSNRTSADIIGTIAALGRTQDMEVLAESVETQAQRDLLGKLGCNCFQGDFYSPALDESECLDYLRTHYPEPIRLVASRA
jgi:lactose/cellobiose-specific phosphotransferase system IIC component